MSKDHQVITDNISITIDALSIITLLLMRIVPLKGHSNRIDLMDLIYPSTKLSFANKDGCFVCFTVVHLNKIWFY